ncbi:MAG: hypothetical protein KDE20_17440 [Caldilineaceae bacterium]|nr:hypothetical protein [Caldilineaceae bacterium]
MLWLAIIGAVWLAVWAVLHLREQSSWEAGAVDQTRVAPDVLAGGVLFWLILGFFWRTVSGDVYQPADGGDLVSFLFPTYRFAAQQLSQGVLPLWNPHLYGGAPFISDIQAGFLYPVNAALFLLRPDFDYKTMQWLAIGHLYWAGLGVYVLLRALRPGGRSVARLGALLGGLAWALVGGALANHLLDNIPAGDRPAHLAWYNFALNAAILGGSLVGPVVATTLGLVDALLIGFVLRLLAGVALWFGGAAAQPADSTSETAGAA